MQWHSGFGAALRITLQSEMPYLEMHEEYLLNKKPLQVDVLIVRKKADIRIEKAVGKIFRQHNIIEYKSPEDYLSINDFYKVYGYACIYQSNTDRVKEIDPELSKKRKLLASESENRPESRGRNKESDGQLRETQKIERPRSGDESDCEGELGTDGGGKENV